MLSDEHCGELRFLTSTGNSKATFFLVKAEEIITS